MKTIRIIGGFSVQQIKKMKIKLLKIKSCYKFKIIRNYLTNNIKIN